MPNERPVSVPPNCSNMLPSGAFGAAPKAGGETTPDVLPKLPKPLGLPKVGAPPKVGLAPNAGLPPKTGLAPKPPAGDCCVCCCGDPKPECATEAPLLWAKPPPKLPGVGVV